VFKPIYIIFQQHDIIFKRFGAPNQILYYIIHIQVKNNFPKITFELEIFTTTQQKCLKITLISLSGLIY